MIALYRQTQGMRNFTKSWAGRDFLECYFFLRNNEEIAVVVFPKKTQMFIGNDMVVLFENGIFRNRSAIFIKHIRIGYPSFSFGAWYTDPASIGCILDCLVDDKNSYECGQEIMRHARANGEYRANVKESLRQLRSRHPKDFEVIRCKYGFNIDNWVQY